LFGEGIVDRNRRMVYERRVISIKVSIDGVELYSGERREEGREECGRVGGVARISRLEGENWWESIRVTYSHILIWLMLSI